MRGKRQICSEYIPGGINFLVFFLRQHHHRLQTKSSIISLISSCLAGQVRQASPARHISPFNLHQTIHFTSTANKQTIMPSSTGAEYVSQPTPLDFDSDPVTAMTSYSRMMHVHTKQQMEAATKTSHRRSSSASPVDAQASLNKSSSRSSQSSQASF